MFAEDSILDKEKSFNEVELFLLWFVVNEDEAEAPKKHWILYRVENCIFEVFEVLTMS